jgi:ADP-ribose pyrophosphatase YjhB (NUDIX family)
VNPSDLPPSHGPVTRLHLWIGNATIFVRSAFMPRLTLGVRLAAFDAAGRVFLVRHSYVPGWYLPGGAVDAGETLRRAAAREAEEEGGLALQAPPAFFHLYFNATTGRRDHIALFTARCVEQVASRAASGPEILETGFFAPDALPEAATRATRARLAEVSAGTPATDLW